MWDVVGLEPCPKWGIRSPQDLLNISSSDLDSLKSKRGWGPILVDNIMKAINQQVVSQEIKKPRLDDEPLPGERQD